MYSIIMYKSIQSMYRKPMKAMSHYIYNQNNTSIAAPLYTLKYGTHCIYHAPPSVAGSKHLTIC